MKARCIHWRAFSCLLLLLFCLGACAWLKGDRTVCAEYRNLRCLSGVRCSYSKARDCRVCQCAEINQLQGAPADEPRPTPTKDFAGETEQLSWPRK